MGAAIGLQHDGPVAVVTLTGADGEHTLTGELLRSLSRALLEAEHAARCRAIVLRADGGAFCRGMDLEVFRDGATPGEAELRHFADLLKQMCRSRHPVIACVEGEASGAGVALAGVCDIVLASTGATFILPELVLGLLPAVVAPFLRRRLPLSRIRYLSLSSKRIDAAEAWHIGLVDEVADDVPAALARQVRRVLCSSPRAVATAKEYFERIDGHDLDAEVEIGLAEAARWLAAGDTLDGVRQFLDGGTPSWFPKERARRFA